MEFDFGSDPKEIRLVIWASAEEVVKVVGDKRKEVGNARLK